jgi:hypothetical protein
MGLNNDVDILPDLRIQADHERVHETSLTLLSKLRAEKVPYGYAMLGVALTLGRLQAGRKLSQEEEVEFITNVMEWCGAYFFEGRAN